MVRAVGFGILSAALCACGPGGSGGTGDPRAEPNADPYGTGQRLVDVLGQRYEAISSDSDTWLDPGDMESVGCGNIPLDQETQVTGVTLLVKDDFDETTEGAIGNYYVQDSFDPPKPNSGITVFQPGFSPPDLRVVAGDVLDIFGLVTEFQGPTGSKFGFCRTLPEMSGSVQLRFENSHVEPLVIDISETATYLEARQYIGMLVTLQDLVVVEVSDSASGRYNIDFDAGSVSDDEDVPNLSNELMDLEAVLPPETMPGTVIREVTGVMTYFYGVHIAPRSTADIVL